jgi:hypothetical protein
MLAERRSVVDISVQEFDGNEQKANPQTQFAP